MKLKALVLFLCFVSIIQSQINNPLLSKDKKAQELWVDSIMRSMSIEQKIGQLFMIQAYSNKGEQHKKFITKMITKYHVGNLIFMQGTPKKQLELTNFYQSRSKIPLMVGFDGEWGLDMRLKNSYRFPWNMTLGAIQNEKLIEEVGQRIGKHCKRIGINVNFAPVVDINTNPNNPIIGNRSFGERKEKVASASIAFTKGMQKTGILANIKHFPGHGDTELDSHQTLPIINFSKKRIDSLELYPFKKQFKAGVISVMIAHLSIPSIEPNKKLPSSLSKNVVTKLLIDELGFKGLIFTDGLNMKGVANYSSSSQINLAAFLAGNDVLLIPQDIPNTILYFKKALKKGTLTERRINRSVKKILQAKFLLGLNKYQPLSEEGIQKDIKSPEDEVLHRKLIKNSLTVIKNKNDILPIKNLINKKIAYVSIGDSDGSSFVNMLKNYTKIDIVKEKELNKLLHLLKKYDLTIIGFHKSNKNPWKSYKFSAKDLLWLKKISKKNKVILDVFASPYSLLKVKKLSKIEGLIVSYQNNKLSQELSAQAIFGAIGMDGKLPVSISKKYKSGYGLKTKSINRLSYTIPEEVDMSSKMLNKIDKYIDTIFKKKMSPGGQILVARKGKVIYNKAFGYHTYNKIRRVKKSDVYDLASLTKILATLPMIMKAVEQKKISINSTLGNLLPFFKKSNKDSLKLKQVLSHNAGLKSWIPFYKHTQDRKGNNLKKYYRSNRSKKFSIKVANKLFLRNDWKDSIKTIIKNSKLKPTLKYQYSDLGFYLLKEILEKKYRNPLNKIVDYFFYKSLGLNRTSYLPLDKLNKFEIIPTEKDKYFRRQLIHGYVHDMGAAMQGGVGGHAGLFSNANDVAKIIQMYLQGGEYGGIQYLKPQTINEFNKRYYSQLKNRRGLGFDKPQINPKEKPTCGCVSQSSFGHSGFTGTYTWVDPKTGILYVFLSNRTYPTMRNKSLIKSNLRTKIQRVIQEAIVD